MSFHVYCYPIRIILLLAITAALAVGWLVADFKARPGVRRTLGIVTILWSFAVASLVGALRDFNANDNFALLKLLERRLPRWGFLAVVLIAIGASVGGMGQRHYRLGATWLGGVLGIQSTTIVTPLDLEARTATLQIQFPTWPAEFQTELLEAYGAQNLSVGVGEMVMMDRDTANYTWVAYAVTEGHPAVIKAIWVVRGTWNFTGVVTAVNAETMCINAPDVPLCPWTSGSKVE